MHTFVGFLYVVDIFVSIYFLFKDDWQKATYFGVAALIVKS